MNKVKLFLCIACCIFTLNSANVFAETINDIRIPDSFENLAENDFVTDDADLTNIEVATLNVVNENQFSYLDWDELIYFQSDTDYGIQFYNWGIDLNGDFYFSFMERQPYQYGSNRDPYTLSLFLPNGDGTYSSNRGWGPRYSTWDLGYWWFSKLTIPANLFKEYSSHDMLYFKFYVNNRYAYIKLTNPVNSDWILKDNNKWEYYENGIRSNGWKSIDGLQYYFENEEMVSDWWLDQRTGAWYFFKGGVMQRGNVLINGRVNIFDTYGVWKGVMIPDGWQLQSNNKWKYYKNNVAVNGWQSIGGLQYLFVNQEMVSDWWLDKNTGAWYFFNGGVMQRKNLVINGKVNIFDTYGVWRGVQE